MREIIGTGMRAAPLLVYLFLGCTTTDNLKPPKKPEEFKVPPVEDKRFSQPIQYPKGTLNNEPIKKAMNKDVNKMGLKGAGAGGPGSN